MISLAASLSGSQNPRVPHQLLYQGPVPRPFPAALHVFAIARIWEDGVGRAIRHFPRGAVGGLGGCVAGKLTMKIELPIFDFQGAADEPMKLTVAFGDGSLRAIRWARRETMRWGADALRRRCPLGFFPGLF